MGTVLTLPRRFPYVRPHCCPERQIKDDEYCGTRFRSSRREARSIGTQPSNLSSLPYEARTWPIGRKRIPRHAEWSNRTTPFCRRGPPLVRWAWNRRTENGWTPAGAAGVHPFRDSRGAGIGRGARSRTRARGRPGRRAGRPGGCAGSRWRRPEGCRPCSGSGSGPGRRAPGGRYEPGAAVAAEQAQPVW